MKAHVIALALVVLAPLAAASTPADPACAALPNSPAPAQLACIIAAGLAFGVVGKASQPPDPDDVPSAEEAGQPAALCAAADAQIDSRAQSSSWYETCGGAITAQAWARVYPTQVSLSCGSNSCTYRPTYHVAVDGTLAGDWVIRGVALLRNVNGGGVGGVVPGSTRAFECAASGIGGACHGQAVGPDIVAGNFNTYKWEGSWALFFVDAIGEERLMSTGGHACYIAQYYGGGVCPPEEPTFFLPPIE